MTHKSKVFTGIIVGTLFIIVAVGSQAAAVSATTVADPARGEAVMELGGEAGRGLLVRFEILPRPVKALSDLVLVVNLSRAGRALVDAEVQVDLTMPAMFMGKNRPVLKHVGEGRYEGKAVLPRCMSGDKRWQAEILVKEGSGEARALFPFELP